MNIKIENNQFSIEERVGGVSLIFKKTQPYKVIPLAYEELASFLGLIDKFCTTVSATASIQPKNNGKEKQGDFPRVSQI